MIAAISGFTNPFCSDVNPNELYCLSSGVPAKPDVADDFLKAPEIGRNAMENFVKKRLVDKTVNFHDPIKRNKLKVKNICSQSSHKEGDKFPEQDKPD